MGGLRRGVDRGPGNPPPRLAPPHVPPADRNRSVSRPDARGVERVKGIRTLEEATFVAGPLKSSPTV